MKFVEKVAKTIDDAVTEALLELMVTRDEVEIEIIEKGSKGFLGIGTKEARVRVTLKSDDQPALEETIKEPVEEITSEVEEPVKEPIEETVDPVKVGEDFLAEVLNKMGIEATIQTSISKDQVKMIISGEKMGLIIGKRGETLDAIQYLVNLVVNKQTDKYTRVLLDTENYRQRREETLKKLAYRLAKKATQTKQKVVLEPMNPYDRRIIHSALQHSKTVKTYSEGQEPYRKVVIISNELRDNNK